MVLQLFSPPGDGVTLQSCKLGEICDAVSFEFEKFFCGAGMFTLEIPANSSCADKIEVNTLIYSREDDMCFIVKNLKKTENTLKITGYDLNGMLLDRLTGFRAAADAKQNRSGVSLSAYSSGIIAVRLEKAFGLNNAYDNYTDAVIIRSNEQINLTGYSKMRIMAVAFRNNSPLTGKVFFLAGEPPAAQSGANYNFSNWQYAGSCDIVTTDYGAPGSPETYDIDILALSGNQFLNFGIYHGNETNTNSVYFDIHKITLIP